MRYALIDNSTITAIQRLLGHIPIKNKLTTDMDILCLENLIQAILFYDGIVILDDYKPEFSDSRKLLFPDSIFMNTESLPYIELLSQTKQITDKIVPHVEAGQFTDQDFKPFFDLLKMNVTFTWDLTSSNYFLTQKMLESAGGLSLQKYSQLSSAIHDELIDKNRSIKNNSNQNIIVLTDRFGNPINDSYVLTNKEGSRVSSSLSKQAKAFFSGLSWLAFRTVLYSLVADNLHIDLFLHPIRHSFQANLLSRLHSEGPSTFKPLIDAMNNSSNSAINSILGRSQPLITKSEIPLFTSWISQKVQNPLDYIDFAYTLKHQPPFVQARQRFIELESTINLNDENSNRRFTEKANKILNEVDKCLEDIKTKYSATNNQGISTSHMITAWNIVSIFHPISKIPNIDYKIPQLEFLKHIIPQKGFKSVYRTLTSDLSQVSRLGSSYEKISSRIVLDENAEKYYAKTETEKFRNSISSWKIPM